MSESQPTALLPNEQWRPVVGWEGLYEVSSIGRVRSLDRVVRSKDVSGKWTSRVHRGKVLSTDGRTEGYPIVRLCRDGKGRTMCVHQLVGPAFLGPPPTPNHEINHKHPDGDRTRCTADNLEWVTRSENVKHRHEVLGFVVSEYTRQCARESNVRRRLERERARQRVAAPALP